MVGGLAAGTVLAAVGGRPLTDLFLQENSRVAGGAVWQLFTSIFVAPPTSLGLLDVGFNSVALVWLDGLFSLAYSGKQYFAVFLATALAGNLLSLANGPNVESFGASGGIFGLLAGVVSFDLAASKRLNFTLVAWFATVFIFSSFFFSSADWIAHAGGALVGLALGYAIGASRRDEG